jgi:phage terminase large subunit-like protein
VGHYAQMVVNGDIVAGKQVRCACQRHFDDLAKGKRRGLIFDPATAKYAIDFFPNFLRHSKGEWGGQPLVLAPWQEFIIGSAFGWFNKDGTRRYRTVYLEIARKNGKSTILAGVGLIGLIADGEPGAEIYAAATRKDQAMIIFSEAQRMVRAAPGLRSKVAIFKYNLSIDATASKFEPLTADEQGLDGLNPHIILIDEVHKHKSRGVFDVLDTAMGSRRNAMLWMITTAGDENPETIYAQENAYANKVTEGIIKDDAYFAYISTLDKEDDWTDPKVWIKANPNLGISVKIADLRRQAAKAKNSPSDAVAFKRLRLNVRSSDAYRAIDMAVWSRNSCGQFDPMEHVGRRFFGALDLSSKIDLSAWIKLFPPDAQFDRWMVVSRFWMPADTVDQKAQRDRVQYQRWIETGLVEATAGNIIDHAEVEAAVKEDCRLFSPYSIAYDPWNATQLAVGLATDGLPMSEFIQGFRSYTAPTKELEAMLLAEQLDHGGNEVLTWMASNLHVLIDKNENKMPSKRHSIGRIDGITALIMSIGRSMADNADRNIDGFMRNPLSV